MASKYDGCAEKICPTGGSVTVPIALTVGQGNAGVALPCKGCWVVVRSAATGPVHMNIGAAASATLGIELSEGQGSGGPLWIPISDVSQLYFYSGTPGDDIDITYLVG